MNIPDFSKVWVNVPKACKRRGRKAYKTRIARANRRKARVNPESSNYKLNSWDIT